MPFHKHSIFTFPLSEARNSSAIYWSFVQDWPTLDWLTQKCEQYFGVEDAIALRIEDLCFVDCALCSVFIGTSLPRGCVQRAARRASYTREFVRDQFQLSNGFVPPGVLSDSFTFHWTLVLNSHSRRLRPVSQPSPFIIEVRPNAYIKLEKSPLESRLA